MPLGFRCVSSVTHGDAEETGQVVQHPFRTPTVVQSTAYIYCSPDLPTQECDSARLVVQPAAAWFSHAMTSQCCTKVVLCPRVPAYESNSHKARRRYTSLPGTDLLSSRASRHLMRLVSQRERDRIESSLEEPGASTVAVDGYSRTRPHYFN